MKYIISTLVFIAALFSGNICNAQAANSKPKTAAAQPAAPAGAVNAKDLEGKWKVTGIDVRMTAADGKELKNNLPGDPADYFEMSNGKMISHILHQTDTSSYKIAGSSLIVIANGETDTMHIVTLTKTILVLNTKENSPEGVAEMTINMKR